MGQQCKAFAGGLPSDGGSGQRFGCGAACVGCRRVPGYYRETSLTRLALRERLVNRVRSVTPPLGAQRKGEGRGGGSIWAEEMDGVSGRRREGWYRWPGRRTDAPLKTPSLRFPLPQSLQGEPFFEPRLRPTPSP